MPAARQAAAAKVPEVEPQAQAVPEEESVAENLDGKFRVVNLGAAYKQDGKKRGFARKGEVLTLDEGEAERLLDLGAVVPASDPDPIPGEAGEHARRLESLEEHADKVRAQVAAKQD